MNRTVDAYDEMRDLVDLLCRDQISAAQVQRLQTLAAASIESRRFFAQYMQMHAALAWQFRDPPLPIEEPPSPILGFLTAAPPSVAWLMSPKLIGLGIATGLFGYFFVLMISIAISRSWFEGRSSEMRSESHTRQSNHSRRPLPANGVDVGRLATDADVRWTRGSSVPKDATVRVGQRYELTQGRVQLLLASGTRVIVEGPAVWQVASDQRFEFTLGRLAARVPHSAVGFTVVTPMAEVIDLGTEFGVEVDRHGTDVHVLQGDVEVKPGPKASDSGNSRGTKLAAGQAARISAKRQTASSIPFDGARFSSVLSAEAEMSDGLAGPSHAVDARPLAVSRVSASSGKVDLHPAARGNTIRFQQEVDGYLGTADVMLSGFDNGTTYHQEWENFGAEEKMYLFEGEPATQNFRRILMRFDLSSITPGTRISGASLTIFFAFAHGTKGVTNSLYLVDPANKDWTPAAATWNNKNQAAEVPWAGGTPGLVAGRDYSSSAIATAASPVRADEAMTFTLDPAGIAAIQDWISRPADNSGFFFRQPDASGSIDNFHSSEAANPALHPLLTLTIDRQAKGAKRDGNPQASQPDGAMWRSRGGRVKGEFVLFDLGRVQRLGSMQVWNYSDAETRRDNGQGVSRADIFVSQSGQGDPLSRPDAWTAVAVDQKLRRADGSATTPAPDVIPLGERNARFVAIVVKSNFNADQGQRPANDRVGLSDVQFFKARSHQQP